MKSYAQRMKKPQIANLQQTPAVGASLGNQAMAALMGYDESKSKSNPALEEKMRAKLQKQFSFPNQEAHRESGGVPLPPAIQKKYEEKSGLPMDDVRVHYNSDKPAKVDALAYTQGTDIFVGDGQEKYLEHEIGHVIQQKTMQVQPTKVLNGMCVNDESTLEHEACSGKLSSVNVRKNFFAPQSKVIQRKELATIGTYTITDTLLKDFISIQKAQYPKGDERIAWLDKLSATIDTTHFCVLDKDKDPDGNMGTHYALHNDKTGYLAYSTNPESYLTIPNIKEDYKQNATKTRGQMILNTSGGRGVEDKKEIDETLWAILVTFVHELGHAEQYSEQGDSFGTSSVILREYHNIAKHENSVAERKRLVYQPDNLELFKHLIHPRDLLKPEAEDAIDPYETAIKEMKINRQDIEIIQKAFTEFVQDSHKAENFISSLFEKGSNKTNITMVKEIFSCEKFLHENDYKELLSNLISELIIYFGNDLFFVANKAKKYIPTPERAPQRPTN